MYWLLLGALLALAAMLGSATDRRRRDLLNRQVEDQAVDALPIKDHPDHGTRTHAAVPKYVSGLPPV